MALEENTQAAITRKKGKATPGRRTRKVKTTASRAAGKRHHAPALHDGRLLQQCALRVEQGGLAKPCMIRAA